MNSIAIVDYGMGNLRSVAKAVEHVAGSAQVIVTSEARVIAEAERVIFPGQGAARDCMAEIEQRGLRAAVQEAARHKPFLGICMGLQVLLDHSTENEGVDGLGVLPGQVQRFPEPLSEDGRRLKIPHMGWNRVHQTRAHPLWFNIPQAARFYFVHSYFVVPANSLDTVATCSHGVEFACALARDQLFAVQFHPEKSQRWGLQLLENFVAWRGQPG